MTKFINLTVRFICIASFLVSGCSSPKQDQDNQAVEHHSNQEDYVQFMVNRVDTVRAKMSHFFGSIQPNDSLQNVELIRNMHYSTGHIFMNIDTTAVPEGDSLVWTMASSLKRFYLESQHLLSNEALFVLDSLPLNKDQKSRWVSKLNAHVQQEKQYYSLFSKHAGRESDSFWSVYQPLYHRLGLTE